MTVVAVVRAAANTATGNQNFTTTDLGGLTPSAALFIATRAVTNNTAAAHAPICIGAATSTSQRWAMFSTSQDGQADTAVTRRAATTQCLMIPLAGGGIDGEADFVSFITNGVQINWTDAPANAYLITVVLFANLSGAYAGTFAPGTSVGAAVDVTAPNFQPDLVFLASHGDAFDDTSSAFHSPGFGWAVRDGSNTQLSVMQSEQDGQAAGTPRAYLSTSYGIATLSVNSNNLLWASEIGSFDSQGFSATLRIASAGTDEVGYLALALNGDNVWAGTHATPTATGNQASTAPGFRPQAVFLGMTHLTAVNNGSQNASAGPYGVAVITANAQYSNAIAIENGAAITNTQGLGQSIAADIDNDDGATGIEATLVSLDATGWTLDFTSVLGSARQWVALAIGQTVGQGMLLAGKRNRLVQ
jgi:hypothetical protein